LKSKVFTFFIIFKNIFKINTLSQKPDKLLEQVRQALGTLKGEFSPEQLEQARQGLATGDVSHAEKLFRQVLLLSGNKEKAAEAAYQLAQLAYGRIDYAAAYRYSKEAADLQPDNSLYLNYAGFIAHKIGRYSEAEPLYRRSLAISEKALGPRRWSRWRCRNR
jgi:tetratricopeptide (TPR) repeat protein